MNDLNEKEEPPRAKSVVGWCVVGGAIILALVGAMVPRNTDLNVVSGAIYGFVLGAIVGVLVDRSRAGPGARR